MSTRMQKEQLVQIAVDALEDMKAKDITVIDVRGKTSVTDFMMIASGTSGRQGKSMADNVIEKVKEQGVRPLGCEGMEVGEWGLIDLGHVGGQAMQTPTREFYDRERRCRGACSS